MKRRMPFDIEFLLESLTGYPIKSNGVDEAESYQPPKLKVGDTILKGKFKNSKAKIKDFKKDVHNHPILKTTKGDVQLFKPRIQKLMEDPNNVDVSPGQAATLKTKGYDYKAISHAYYDQPGAVSFIYEVKSDQIIYAETTDGETGITHPEMGEELWHFVKRPKAFGLGNGKGGRGGSIFPSEDMDVGPGGTESTIFSLDIKGGKDFAKYIFDMVEEVPLDGDIPRDSKKFILGRYWPRHRTISFWRPKDAVMAHIEAFNRLIRSFKGSPDKTLWEFIDIEYLFSYDELEKHSVKSRSDAEQKELMAKQHINPDAKRKLAKMQNALNQKKSPGFDFQAQKDASMPALQELAKKVLQESPDGFYAGKGLNGDWRDYDALTFMTFPTFCLLAPMSGITHSYMTTILKRCHNNGNLKPMKEEGILCSDENALKKDLFNSGGITNDYLNNGYDDEVATDDDSTEYTVEGSDYEETDSGDDEYNSNQVPHVEFRDMKNSLSGRLWHDKRKNIISFWNEQSKVLKFWPQVQKMFKKYHDKLGNLEDYRVDWIERENDMELPLTPASSVTSSAHNPDDKDEPVPEVDINGQMNFIEKIFQDPNKLKKLSAEQLKNVRSKMHVFDPQVKAQLMKMSGEHVHKAAQIADILGMSVVEFNHLTQVAESSNE